MYYLEQKQNKRIEYICIFIFLRAFIIIIIIFFALQVKNA